MAEKRKTRKCVICGNENDSSTHLYAVPKEDCRLLEWVIACGQLLPPKSFVCSRHFPISKSKKLKKGDVPSVRQVTQYVSYYSPEDDTIPISMSPTQDPALTEIDCSTNEESQESFAISLHSPIPQLIQPMDIVNNDEFGSLFKILSTVGSSFNLPITWGVHELVGYIVLLKINIQQDDMLAIIDRSIIIRDDTIIARVKNKSIELTNIIKTTDDLENYIKDFDKAKICPGNSKSCSVVLLGNLALCNTCRGYKHYHSKRDHKKQQSVIVKKHKKRRLQYISTRNQHLKNVINNLKGQKIDTIKIDHFLKDLPEIQQEMIRACCKAATSRKNGIRYTLEWVYSCILMKIKGPKLYHHMRENNLLSLPSPSTLSR
ncbi:unnamed protein product [Phaedon cochleariae]|uniref:THAP-type domain-containing protein n=1 Tax=Phaedon cochleariae TaxID=80249 RepID=A0A9N9SP08_PHACE|nr:unnamed protein product [Phaedon cochleariae]